MAEWPIVVLPVGHDDDALDACLAALDAGTPAGARIWLADDARIGPRGAEDDSTSFAEGMITVRAVAPATATDLNAATTVTFAGLGVEGGSATMTGLPAEASLMLGNTELRLVVGPSGVPGFAAASLTTCRPR